jgi:hypothetical protein
MSPGINPSSRNASRNEYRGLAVSSWPTHLGGSGFSRARQRLWI